MQTFLPYPSFSQSAACLDDKRLGKQRVEVLQILNTLTGKSKGWANHPAVKMWKGYEIALVEYGLEICEEWIKRGFKDSCKEKIKESLVNVPKTTMYKYCYGGKNPPWLGNEDFHLSHQSNLVAKYPEHYRKYFPDVPDNLGYMWPVK